MIWLGLSAAVIQIAVAYINHQKRIGSLAAQRFWFWLGQNFVLCTSQTWKTGMQISSDVYAGIQEENGLSIQWCFKSSVTYEEDPWHKPPDFKFNNKRSRFVCRLRNLLTFAVQPDKLFLLLSAFLTYSTRLGWRTFQWFSLHQIGRMWSLDLVRLLGDSQ